MSRSWLFLFFVGLNLVLHGQTTRTTQYPPEMMVYEQFDTLVTPPAFPGGETALYQFIGRQIKYPAEARKKKIQGSVIVEFLIMPDGQVSHVVSLRQVEGGCTEEALRVVRMMPTWTPGLKDGHPVTVRYVLPITFKLS